MNGWRSAVHLFACAIGLRVLLLHVGVGDQLGWRVEVATPANSLLGVREGLTHAQHGISPYRGQACHTPPLVLWLHKAWALHPTLYAIPNIAWDVLAALMLLDTGRRLELHPEAAPARTSAAPAPSSTQPSFPLLLAGLYLLNPLTLAACLSGCTSSWENLAVLAVLWRGCAKDPAGAALALALATYSCPQSGLLLVGDRGLAVALLAVMGPEDIGPGGGIAQGNQGSQGLPSPHTRPGPGQGPTSSSGGSGLTNVAAADGGGSASVEGTGAGLDAGSGSNACMEPEEVSKSEGQVAGPGKGARAGMDSKSSAAGLLMLHPEKDRGREDGQRHGQEQGHGQQAQQGVQHQGASVQVQGRGLQPYPSTARLLASLLLFASRVAAWLLLLLLASDWSLAEHPDAPCLPGMRQGLSWLWAVPMRLRPAVTPHLSKQSTLGLDPLLLAPGPAAAAGQPYPNPSTPASPHTGRCWALHVYQLPLLVEDIQPNIGQLWYFFTQMFPQYLAFFRFVTHSLSAVMVVPLALRFPRRPLLLFTAQCITAAMWKPYPSVADLALYMALLPLLRPQLRRMQTGVLLAGSFLLLAVLEPAMWHQWVEVESANSNFYYSITLLLGAWHVLLLVQLLLLTVQASFANRTEQRSQLSQRASATECKLADTMQAATPGMHPGTRSATPARLVTPPDRPHTSAGSVELAAQRTLYGGINYKQGDQDLQEGPTSSGRSPSRASTFISSAPVTSPTANHSLALSEQQGAEAGGGPSVSPRASDEHSTTSQLRQPSVSPVAHTVAAPGATPPTPPAALTPAHPTATLDPVVHLPTTSSVAGSAPLSHCHSPGRPSPASGPLACKRTPPLQHLQSLRRALSSLAAHSVLPRSPSSPPSVLQRLRMGSAGQSVGGMLPMGQGGSCGSSSQLASPSTLLTASSCTAVQVLEPGLSAPEEGAEGVEHCIPAGTAMQELGMGWGEEEQQQLVSGAEGVGAAMPGAGECGQQPGPASRARHPASSGPHSLHTPLSDQGLGTGQGDGDRYGLAIEQAAGQREGKGAGLGGWEDESSSAPNAGSFRCMRAVRSLAGSDTAQPAHGTSSSSGIAIALSQPPTVPLLKPRLSRSLDLSSDVGISSFIPPKPLLLSSQQQLASGQPAGQVQQGSSCSRLGAPAWRTTSSSNHSAFSRSGFSRLSLLRNSNAVVPLPCALAAPPQPPTPALERMSQGEAGWPCGATNSFSHHLDVQQARASGAGASGAGASGAGASGAGASGAGAQASGSVEASASGPERVTESDSRQDFLSLIKLATWSNPGGTAAAVAGAGVARATGSLSGSVAASKCDAVTGVRAEAETGTRAGAGAGAGPGLLHAALAGPGALSAAPLSPPRVLQPHLAPAPLPRCSSGSSLEPCHAGQGEGWGQGQGSEWGEGAEQAIEVWHPSYIMGSADMPGASGGEEAGQRKMGEEGQEGQGDQVGQVGQGGQGVPEVRPDLLQLVSELYSGSCSQPLPVLGAPSHASKDSQPTSAWLPLDASHTSSLQLPVGSFTLHRSGPITMRPLLSPTSAGYVPGSCQQLPSSCPKRGHIARPGQLTGSWTGTGQLGAITALTKGAGKRADGAGARGGASEGGAGGQTRAGPAPGQGAVQAAGVALHSAGVCGANASAGSCSSSSPTVARATALLAAMRSMGGVGHKFAASPSFGGRVGSVCDAAGGLRSSHALMAVDGRASGRLTLHPGSNSGGMGPVGDALPTDIPVIRQVRGRRGGIMSSSGGEDVPGSVGRSLAAALQLQHRLGTQRRRPGGLQASATFCAPETSREFGL
ncbi:hypothetical protein QJQ45_010074 [Haematococcus lacustris]|nr:hypothetical protein QJQ45_010074 [Haematococcus lacustris]